ncbi:MAG TPA: hypothetical protein PLY72_02705, partial [Candidatus Obscuribacter sp.]|nr:hypothetical protein [Candidatus Obscuribacter sp.]
MATSSNSSNNPAQTTVSSVSKFDSPALSYEVQAVCPWSGARAGLLTTPHGVVETPVFMPVGTNA